MKDNIPNLASCTKEFIEAVANIYPEYLIDKDGNVDICATLYLCGFHITNKDYLRGIRITEDAVVRSWKYPYMTYKTTVYSGKCRKAVKGVDSEGKVLYDMNKWHCMKPFYEKCEILQPTNLEAYIDVSTLRNILEIGDMVSYNKINDGVV